MSQGTLEQWNKELNGGGKLMCNRKTMTVREGKTHDQTKKEKQKQTDWREGHRQVVLTCRPSLARDYHCSF